MLLYYSMHTQFNLKNSTTVTSFKFQDVKRLTSTLPNLVSDFQVPFDGWSHQDFVYGIDAYKLLYPEILKNMDKFRPTTKNH